MRTLASRTHELGFEKSSVQLDGLVDKALLDQTGAAK